MQISNERDDGFLVTKLGADFRVERPVECFLDDANQVDSVAKIHRVQRNRFEIAAQVNFQLCLVVVFFDELRRVFEDLLAFGKNVRRRVRHQTAVLPFVLALALRVARLVVRIAVVLVWKAIESPLVRGESSLGIIGMVVVVLIVVLGVVRDGVVEVTLRRRGKVISWAGVAGVALELRTTRIIVARIGRMAKRLPIMIMRRSRVSSEKVRAVILIINVEPY